MSTLSRRDLLVGTASAFGAASCAPAILDPTCASNYRAPGPGPCPASGTDAGASKQERNKIVLAALDGLKKSKPAAFYSPESARLITIVKRLFSQAALA